MVLYFVTGATGFLGREFLVRLLRRSESVCVLMRKRPGSESPENEAYERIRNIIQQTDSQSRLENLIVVLGDVTQNGLNLCEKSRAKLYESESCCHIVHGAAQVRFDLPLDEMRRQNVQGTKHVLELAQALHSEGKLHRFDYVSTAYIAGAGNRLAREDEIDVGQQCRNAYEQSKLEAELLVSEAREKGLPVTVYRPSIIVGDSRTGRASSFKVLYWPLRIYAKGRWRTCFGRRACTIDIVPVDFVADAMAALVSMPQATSKTVHLAAGPDGQARILELVALAERFFSGKKVRYFDPELYHKYLRPVLLPLFKLFRPDVAHRGGFFLPYLIENPSFSLEIAQSLLDPEEIRPPDVRSYFEQIMSYARETDFGSRR